MSSLSSFEISVTKTQEMVQLKRAIDNGDIVACSDYQSNVFPVSKSKMPGLIEDWQKSYPDVEGIHHWKHCDFDDDEIFRKHKFKTGVTNGKNGREVKLVLLGVRPIPNKNKVECFEFCVEYKFEAYHHQRKSEAIGPLERIFIGTGTLGISEILFRVENYVLSSKEEDNRKLVLIEDNAKALAAMLISKSCPRLKVTWESGR